MFFPLHRAVRRHRLLQVLLSRISPLATYFQTIPQLDDRLQYEWALLDTHDGLTDYYKHLRSETQLRSGVQRAWRAGSVGGERRQWRGTAVSPTAREQGKAERACAFCGPITSIPPNPDVGHLSTLPLQACARAVWTQRLNISATCARSRRLCGRERISVVWRASFDVVHAQFGSACALVTAAVEGIPRIVTIRGSDWNTHDGFGFLYFHTRLAATLTRHSLGAYEQVISVSRRAAAGLARAAPHAPVAVLPSPVDLSRFAPRDKQEAKGQLGYPHCSEKWVLFNSLDLHNPIKRFDLARRAFEIAQSRLGNLRLRLATDLPQSAMPLFVGACDVLLCTSRYEGWPNSVKEALACNVPFVATDVSDLSDIARIEPDCRVCAAEPRILADNICAVLARPPPADLARHVAQMSPEASADRLISIYRAALARRHPSAQASPLNEA